MIRYRRVVSGSSYAAPFMVVGLAPTLSFLRIALYSLNLPSLLGLFCYAAPVAESVSPR